jgi:minichromosome maintenance protein 10
MREYLRGRYYLPPSRLYSVVRLLPDKQGYDIPVAGDWVTIAVVAERGPVKFTRPPVGIGNERDDDQLQQGGSSSTPRKQPQDSKAAGKKKPENVPAPMMGKKYVNVKLIDFGARSRSSSSATGGKEIIRGDAFLTLLLFESDGTDSITKEDGKVEKVYKGGSRGAFESMSKLKEGDVIALLNPKILKPFQVYSSSHVPE